MSEMSQQSKTIPRNPDWPVGKVATRIVLFTQERSSMIEKLLKLLHEAVNVVNPNDARSLAIKHNIKILPTIIFLYKDHEINRLEG